MIKGILFHWEKVDPCTTHRVASSTEERLPARKLKGAEEEDAQIHTEYSKIFCPAGRP